LRTLDESVASTRDARLAAAQVSATVTVVVAMAKA
jgi:hypothetical protein